MLDYSAIKKQYMLILKILGKRYYQGKQNSKTIDVYIK